MAELVEEGASVSRQPAWVLRKKIEETVSPDRAFCSSPLATWAMALAFPRL